MKTNRFFALGLVLSLVVLVAFGCASNQQSKATAEADNSWQYPQIVDAAFVGQYAKVPMPEDVMIIDSRPHKPKYVKGHMNLLFVVHIAFEDKSVRLISGRMATRHERHVYEN